MALDFSRLLRFFQRNDWTNAAAYLVATASGTGTVNSVTAADTSIVVNSSDPANPTVATGALNLVAADHPPTADWSNNSHKITSVANGTNPQDVAAFGQIPTSLPPVLDRTATITVPDHCCVVAVNYFSGSAVLAGDAAMVIF